MYWENDPLIRHYFLGVCGMGGVRLDSHDINSVSIQKFGRNFPENMSCQASLKQPSRYIDLYICQVIFNHFPTPLLQVICYWHSDSSQIPAKSSNLDLCTTANAHCHTDISPSPLADFPSNPENPPGFHQWRLAANADRFTGHGGPFAEVPIIPTFTT